MTRVSKAELDEAARSWKGPYRPYDLVKEFVVALGVVAAIVIVAAALFSSPDDAPVTIAQWARQAPVDFVTTAVAELDGSSQVATYGPPYNHNGTAQHTLFIRPEKWLGVSHPVNTSQDYVIAPLATIPNDPAVQAAVSTWSGATSDQQTKWTDAYTKGIGTGNTLPAKLPPGDYGPVPTMMTALLNLAQSGGLDGALLTSRQFFQTDYTKPLLFMSDSTAMYFAGLGQAQHLLGTQWGMMNETGSYPGQVWLWLYTFWYQVKPIGSSANADLIVFEIMAVLSLLFICIPLLPGVRSIPRWVPLYKLIWRNHYRDLRASSGPP